MDKKYCDRCCHLIKATEFEKYAEQIQFARCGVFFDPNIYGNVSLAFDTEKPMYCAAARADTRYCGPDAKGYKELIT